MTQQREFSFPREWIQYPPFFTIQKHQDILNIQLEQWRKLVLDYCTHYGIHEMNLQDWVNREPFCNSELDRSLKLNGIKTVMDSMVERKCAEWIDENKESCLIYTKSPKQWADSIMAYVKENSLHNNVLTFYELIEGDSTKNCDFHKLDDRLFKGAIRVLEQSGKAALMEVDGMYGVKFI